ncbi:MAG: hypothetical protein QF477_00545, partial [SAR202 cluster bacterium]|nr:hypothetical protein [SAR202 cluster bacterium]
MAIGKVAFAKKELELTDALSATLSVLRRPFMLALLVALVAFGITASVAPARAGTTWIVRNTNDSFSGSLRQAIYDASPG